MNVGFVGLGKIDLPCALAIKAHGHNVWSFNIDVNVKRILATKKLLYKEIWAHAHLEKSNVELVGLQEVARRSDVIFVPIQTPHDPLCEGNSRIPETRVDFVYTRLKNGMKILSDADRQKKLESKDV